MEVDFFVLLTWGGSNKTVHPTSPNPHGQVHTSWLGAVKAPQLISIQQCRWITVRRPSVEEMPRGSRRKTTKKKKILQISQHFNWVNLRVVQLRTNWKEGGKSLFLRTCLVCIIADRHSIENGGSLYLTKVERLLHLNAVLSSKQWIRRTVNISHWGLSCSVK